VILKSHPFTNRFVSLANIIIALVGTFFIVPSIKILILSLFLFFILFWFGHNIGQHRYLSHEYFSLSRPVHYVIVYLANAVGYGSAFGWATFHRNHHLTSDTGKDPYHFDSPLKAFLNITNYDHIRYFRSKLLGDRFVVFTHKYYHPFLIVNSIVLFLISPVLWISYHYSVIMCYFAFIWTAVFSHKKTIFSYKNFDGPAYNDFIYGYILGDWHNNHHTNPHIQNQKVKWWEFDIIDFFIRKIKSV